MTAAMPELEPAQRRSLLRLARASLETWIRDRRRLAPEEIEAFGFGGLRELRLNVFVSLHRRGALRGCIGTLAASEPIPQAIANAAISAGARDPRFEPVSLRELSECDIEISILGPLTRVRSMDEIVAGRHGLVVEKDGRRGLLLPQVAQKYGWTAREFLRQTYAKAGLAPSEEIGSASVQAFEAIVFGELDDIR